MHVPGWVSERAVNSISARSYLGDARHDKQRRACQVVSPIWTVVLRVLQLGMSVDMVYLYELRVGWAGGGGREREGGVLVDRTWMDLDNLVCSAAAIVNLSRLHAARSVMSQ
jgi:hypothetical protein